LDGNSRTRPAHGAGARHPASIGVTNSVSSCSICRLILQSRDDNVMALAAIDRQPRLLRMRLLADTGCGKSTPRFVGAPVPAPAAGFQRNLRTTSTAIHDSTQRDA
jgi:hypothetical protein